MGGQVGGCHLSCVNTPCSAQLYSVHLDTLKVRSQDKGTKSHSDAPIASQHGQKVVEKPIFFFFMSRQPVVGFWVRISLGSWW